MAGVRKTGRSICALGTAPGKTVTNVLNTLNTPLKSNIDTKHDGPWKMYFLSTMAILGIYVRFQGGTQKWRWLVHMTFPFHFGVILRFQPFVFEGVWQYSPVLQSKMSKHRYSNSFIFFCKDPWHFLFIIDFHSYKNKDTQWRSVNSEENNFHIERSWTTFVTSSKSTRIQWGLITKCQRCQSPAGNTTNVRNTLETNSLDKRNLKGIITSSLKVFWLLWPVLRTYLCFKHQVRLSFFPENLLLELQSFQSYTAETSDCFKRTNSSSFPFLSAAPNLPMPWHKPGPKVHLHASNLPQGHKLLAEGNSSESYLYCNGPAFDNTHRSYSSAFDTYRLKFGRCTYMIT